MTPLRHHRRPSVSTYARSSPALSATGPTRDTRDGAGIADVLTDFAAHTLGPHPPAADIPTR
jgi:hypothetical protein